MDQNLNVTVKTIKLLEENIGVNLHVFSFGRAFSDVTPKAWAIKEKNKLTLTKNKNFCASK